MKKLLLFLSLFICASSFAQSKQYIRADSVYIQRDNGNGELILLNATRDSTGGLLTNIGMGRTAFLKTRVLNDSTVIIGKDTLIINGTVPLTDVYSKFTPDDNGYTAVTPFTDTCGVAQTHCNQRVFPELVGKRIRVWVSGTKLSNDCWGGWWYRWYPETGTFQLFPGDPLSSFSFMPVIIEHY